jgi:hypothetical protein
MSQEVLERVVELYRSQLRGIDIRAPFDLPAENVAGFQVLSGPGSRQSVELEFVAGASPTVVHIAKGLREPSTDPGTVTVKLWFWLSIYLQELLGDEHFQYVDYGVDPVDTLHAGQPITGAIDIVGAGDPVATGPRKVSLGFYRLLQGGARRYLSPGIAVRMLAFLSSEWRELLGRLVQLDSNTGLFGSASSRPFALDEFLDFHLNADKPSGRQWVAEQVLRSEYHFLDLRNARDSNYTFGDSARDGFRDRVPHLDQRISFADLSSLVSQPGFATLFPVAAPFRFWEVADRRLTLAVLRADAYDLELVNLRVARVEGAVPEECFFTQLWDHDARRQKFFGDQEFALLINTAMWAWKSHGDDGDPRGSFKFRHSNVTTRHPEDPLPGDLHHVFQDQDGTFHLGQGRLPDSGVAPGHSSAIAVGLDHLTAHVVDGGALFVGEPPPYRADMDSVGVTLFGMLRKDDVEYLFALGRQDKTGSRFLGLGTPSDDTSEVEPGSYAEILALLGAMNTRFAVYPDGGSSAGLIVRDRGVVIPPGRTIAGAVVTIMGHDGKNTRMPMAIGFRRR